GLLLGLNPGQIRQLINNPAVNPPAAGVGRNNEPETAEEIRTRKFSATVLAYTEDVWTEVFDKAGKQYQAPKMVLFSRRVDTGCGTAPSEVGPFYCPADRTVYLDPTFFAELHDRLGGSDAEFSQAYVIAHEVGHHVQNLLGYNHIVEQK